MKKVQAVQSMHRLGLNRALCLSKLSACARVRTKKTAQALALYAAGHSVREVAAVMGVSYGKARGLVASDS